MLTASLPDEDLIARLRDITGTELVHWDLRGPAPRDALDLVVTPYMSPLALLTRLSGVRVRVVQSQMVGYDGVAEALPEGVTFCNAAGVHEASTAELAVGLMIASQRQLPAFVRAQASREWSHQGTGSLADSDVLIMGAGGVGRAIAQRLEPFEVSLTRVARTARTENGALVVGMDTVPSLLGRADIVVLTLPLTPETNGLVDRAFLARMKPGALLVNVGRGALVVTADLVQAVREGRMRAALDVVDPEPLPHSHPLWSLEGVLLTPHVGGHSAAMAPRFERLVRSQIRSLRTGGRLASVVIEGRWYGHGPHRTRLFQRQPHGRRSRAGRARRLACDLPIRRVPDSPHG